MEIVELKAQMCHETFVEEMRKVQWKDERETYIDKDGIEKPTFPPWEDLPDHIREVWRRVVMFNFKV